MRRKASHFIPRLITLACIGAFVAADECVAQAEAGLTVQPREMASGTQNPAAGEYPLDSVPEGIVSVAPQCVGARRCPLLIQLPGGGIPAQQMTDWLRPAADKYGLILLTLTEYEPEVLDAALRETLRRFAIEPAKIAIMGRCASGAAGMNFGLTNRHVFSRVGSISGGIPAEGMDSANTTTEFLLDRGWQEATGMFAAARELRQRRPVKLVLALRGHEHQMEDYGFVAHWLSESWAIPDPAARKAPAVVADPLPELTVEAVQQMTTFWSRFAQEPDTIRTVARRAHLREVIVPVGDERPSVWMTDMPALAAKYPSVASALEKAGLTAQQHEAYRVALISAFVTGSVDGEVGAIEPTSALGKNVAFVAAHADALEALANAGIKQPDEIARVDATATIQHPDEAEAMGPMGIWRTP